VLRDLQLANLLPDPFRRLLRGVDCTEWTSAPTDPGCNPMRHAPRSSSPTLSSSRLRTAALWYPFLTLATACVSPDVAGMGAIDPQGLTRHAGPVSLEVVSARVGDEMEGGLGVIETPELTPAQLEEAIRFALERTEFLGEVVAGARPTLRANLRRARLVSGVTMAREAEVIIDWAWIADEGGEPLWKKRISTTATRTFSDDFSGYARTRRAVEGAVRANIEQAFSGLEASGQIAAPAGSHTP